MIEMKTLSPILDQAKRRATPVLHQVRRTPKRWRWAAAAAAALIVIWAIHAHKSHSKARAKAKPGLIVPIAAAPARSGDMPIYLDGLGSVTAFYNVTVHTRVDGQLMSVPVREGQYVHQGDPLAEIDPRPFQAALDQAEGQLAKDQALLADARLDLDRYKGLLAQDAIPKQQYDTQVATVGQDEGVVKADQAAVETAKLNLIYAHITSPINGRVGLRLVDPGNIVHAADANGLIVIAQLQPITVVFTLPEDSIPRVMQKFHSGATLPVEAWNRDKTQKLATGHLLTVDNEIDPNTGTLKLKAVFDNNENTLFPNQFVNARLLLESKHNAAIIPAVALQRGAQGSFVYVVKADNTVDMRPVTIGVIEGNDASIDSGVQVGDSVVIDGADKLQPGSSVAVQPSNNPSPGGGQAAPAAKTGGR
jgi:multidrug efflux system membrane fusion protein